MATDTKDKTPRRAAATALVCILLCGCILCGMTFHPQTVSRAETPEITMIAKFSTYYGDSSENRKHNIALAAKAIDGSVILPEDEFSFNDTVGARTEARGYRPAYIIQDGTFVEGVGGGVCQVSSTLYNAWVLAGLDVVRVQGHSLPSGYVPMSQDATVSEYIDLVLKNDTAFPVQVRTKTDGTDLSIAVFGKKQPFKVTLLPEILSVVPAGEDIEYVDSLPEGKNYVIARRPRQGYRTRLVATYTYSDGRVVKKQLRRDFYRPTDTKILMIAD